MAIKGYLIGVSSISSVNRWKSGGIGVRIVTAPYAWFVAIGFRIRRKELGLIMGKESFFGRCPSYYVHLLHDEVKPRGRV